MACRGEKQNGFFSLFLNLSVCLYLSLYFFSRHNTFYTIIIYVRVYSHFIFFVYVLLLPRYNHIHNIVYSRVGACVVYSKWGGEDWSVDRDKMENKPTMTLFPTPIGRQVPNNKNNIILLVMYIQGDFHDKRSDDFPVEDFR